MTRSGIMLAITESETDVEMTEADGFEATMELIKAGKFDAVVCDLSLHSENTQLIDMIRQTSQQIIIFIYSVYNESLYALPSILAGADGYLSKKSSREEFAVAWKTVVSGKKYLSPSIQHFLLNQASDPQISNAESLLSKRELEVMQLMKRYYSTNKISELLGVKPNTVSIHKRRILHKLNVKDELDFYSKMLTHP